MLVATCNTGRRASISWDKRANVKEQQKLLMEAHQQPDTGAEIETLLASVCYVHTWT